MADASDRDNVLQIVDELEKLVEFNKGSRNKRYVKEANLLARIGQLRTAVIGTEDASRLLPRIDAIERVVLNSKKSWWGSRIIDEVDFYTEIQKFRWHYEKR